MVPQAACMPPTVVSLAMRALSATRAPMSWPKPVCFTQTDT